MASDTEVTHDSRVQVRSREIPALAGRQHGMVSREQLLALGLGRGAIAHGIAAGRLHPWHRGVNAVGHRVVSREGRWMAAVLSIGPGAVLSHRSAAALWGIRPTSRTLTEVTVGRKVPSRKGIQIHHGQLETDEITVHDGIPVTTPARTLIDLAAVLRPHELVKAVNQAEILRLPFPDLARYRGHRGIRHLRAGREPTVTRNDFEERFAAFLAGHGLPRPLVNTALDGMEPDFTWPAAKLIAELDGFATHGTRQAFERDRARDRSLQAAGWRVVRITWRQLHEQPNLLAAVLAALVGVTRRPADAPTRGHAHT